MFRFLELYALGTAIDMLSLLIVLIPLLLLLHFVYIKDLKRTTWYLVFGVYLAGVFSVVGVPDIRYLTVDPGVNVVPFADMAADFQNAVMNVVLFIPLGFLLPFLWEKFRKFRYTLLFGFGTTLLVEILQIFTYRLTDINDLITNTLGTVIGYSIAHIFIKRSLPSGKTKDAFILSCIVLCLMLTVVHLISSVFWGVV